MISKVTRRRTIVTGGYFLSSCPTPVTTRNYLIKLKYLVIIIIIMGVDHTGAILLLVLTIHYNNLNYFNS